MQANVRQLQAAPRSSHLQLRLSRSTASSPVFTLPTELILPAHSFLFFAAALLLQQTSPCLDAYLLGLDWNWTAISTSESLKASSDFRTSVIQPLAPDRHWSARLETRPVLARSNLLIGIFRKWALGNPVHPRDILSRLSSIQLVNNPRVIARIPGAAYRAGCAKTGIPGLRGRGSGTPNSWPSQNMRMQFVAP